MALLGFFLSVVFFGTSVALMVRLKARAAECIAALRCATESEEARQTAVRDADRLRAELTAMRSAKTAAVPGAAVMLTVVETDSTTPVSAETSLRPRTAPSRRPSTTTAALVLVAGGAAAVRASSLDRLREAGYRVQEATTAESTLTTAISEKPALILLDLSSDPAGWEILTNLKAASALHDTPVLVVCAAKDRERAMEAGAAGCVAEGDSILLSTIKATLTEQKRRAERSRLANRMQSAA